MLLTIMSTSSNEKHSIIWIEVNTSTGNLIIQENHSPIITLLKDQEEVVYCFKTGKKNTLFLAHGGILKVTRTEALLLIY